MGTQVRTDVERARVRAWHLKKYHADPEWAKRRNEYAKGWVRQQKALGLCTKCGDKATHKTVCEEHWWKGRENNWRKRGIPMTLATFFATFEAQGRICALCTRALTPEGAVVDHCHATGRVRGILCVRCNGAIGGLGDTVASIRRALEYLSRGVV